MRSFGGRRRGRLLQRNGNKFDKHFTANVSWTSHRIKFTRLYWTTVSTFAAFARCTESLSKRTLRRSGATSFVGRTTRSRSCWRPVPIKSGHGTSRSSKARKNGRTIYLYVILDIYSRYVVGWMLAHREQAELATKLIGETLAKQNVREDELIIHSDRGPSMTSHSVTQLLISLGVTKSHSRPHVSNDNPFSESHFKTMKYRPEFPDRFGCHEDGLSFCRHFFDWYNNEHYHSGIGLVTPASLHYGQASEVVASRKQARSSWRTPRTRNDSYMGSRRHPNCHRQSGSIRPRTKSRTKRKGFRKSTVPRSHKTRL